MRAVQGTACTSRDHRPRVAIFRENAACRCSCGRQDKCCAGRTVGVGKPIQFLLVSDTRCGPFRGCMALPILYCILPSHIPTAQQTEALLIPDDETVELAPLRRFRKHATPRPMCTRPGPVQAPWNRSAQRFCNCTLAFRSDLTPRHMGNNPRGGPISQPYTAMHWRAGISISFVLHRSQRT